MNVKKSKKARGTVRKHNGKWEASIGLYGVKNYVGRFTSQAKAKLAIVNYLIHNEA